MKRFATLFLCAAACLLLTACGAVQPTTQPTGTVTLPAPTVLDAARQIFADAQPYIAIAAAFDPAISGYNALAGDALTIASNGDPAAVKDAITKVAALAQHPAMVKAKATAK